MSDKIKDFYYIPKNKDIFMHYSTNQKQINCIFL